MFDVPLSVRDFRIAMLWCSSLCCVIRQESRGKGRPLSNCVIEGIPTDRSTVNLIDSRGHLVPNFLDDSRNGCHSRLPQRYRPLCRDKPHHFFIFKTVVNPIPCYTRDPPPLEVHLRRNISRTDRAGDVEILMCSRGSMWRF
jgi:hypothetical protein